MTAPRMTPAEAVAFFDEHGVNSGYPGWLDALGVVIDHARREAAPEDGTGELAGGRDAGQVSTTDEINALPVGAVIRLGRTFVLYVNTVNGWMRNGELETVEEIVDMIRRNRPGRVIDNPINHADPEYRSPPAGRAAACLPDGHAHRGRCQTCGEVTRLLLEVHGNVGSQDLCGGTGSSGWEHPHATPRGDRPAWQRDARSELEAYGLRACLVAACHPDSYAHPREVERSTPDDAPWSEVDELLAEDARRQDEQLAVALGIDIERYEDDELPIADTIAALRAHRCSTAAVEIVNGEQAAQLPVGSLVRRDDYPQFPEPDRLRWRTSEEEWFTRGGIPSELDPHGSYAVVFRAPTPAPTPTVGQVLTTAEELEACPRRTAVRQRGGSKLLCERGDDGCWYVATDFAESLDVESVLAYLGVRVLDLPGSDLGSDQTKES